MEQNQIPTISHKRSSSKFHKCDHFIWVRERFFPANAKHLHLCGFWPPWPHFRRKSDEEAGSSRDFHAISRLKGGSLIIHSLRFPNAKKKLLLSHAIFKGQQFDHMQSLHCLYLLTLHCQTLGWNCFWRRIPFSDLYWTKYT